MRDIEHRFGVDEPQDGLYVIEFEFLCQRDNDAVERALTKGHAHEMPDGEFQARGALVRESVARDVGPRVDDYFYVRGFFIMRDQAASPPARSIGPRWLAGGSNSKWRAGVGTYAFGVGVPKKGPAIRPVP